MQVEAMQDQAPNNKLQVRNTAVVLATVNQVQNRLCRSRPALLLC
jgi:hypothetical protein